MCRYNLEFTGFSSNEPGYIRWTWTATHIGPPYEEYENCIDINGGSPTATQLAAPTSTQLAAPTSTPVILTPTSETSSTRPYRKSLHKRPKLNLQTCSQNGSFKCDNNAFLTCDNNKWIRRNCAEGTICKEIQNSIICDYP